MCQTTNIKLDEDNKLKKYINMNYYDCIREIGSLQSYCGVRTPIMGPWDIQKPGRLPFEAYAEVGQFHNPICIYVPEDEHALVPVDKVTLTVPTLVNASMDVFIDGVTKRANTPVSVDIPIASVIVTVVDVSDN